MRDRVIVALDNMGPAQVREFLPRIQGKIPTVKVGLELYYRTGPDFVRELREQGFAIFLDLKLHDIPHTVAQAIDALAHLPIKFLTIHLSGGAAMVQAAAAKAQEVLPHTTLLGVSFLTSLDQHELAQMFSLSAANLAPTFKKFFTLAAQNNVGLILSPHELPWAVEVEQQTHPLLKICPGIRFADDQKNDQKRISTPQAAFAQHADYVVIGRALTQVTPELLAARLEELARPL
ncbi:MAG: orotidine-5'-phosphate decarboxylase, partial [Bacteriovoracaceae bacterium]|nr:orotidine-5'-phosphate decarboxylase [Bacteriovoracaceae bacterium]